MRALSQEVDSVGNWQDFLRSSSVTFGKKGVSVVLSASHLAQRLAHALQSWHRAPIRPGTAAVKLEKCVGPDNKIERLSCMCVFVFIGPPGPLLKAVD